MAQVLGQGLAEFRELAVGVAVQTSSGGGNGLGDGGLHIRGDSMGVLVDVQQNGDFKLRCAVGAQSTQVGPEGKSVKSFKLLTHYVSLRGRCDCKLTVTPGHLRFGAPADT